MEVELITKKNFEKYFEKNNIIDISDYKFYLRMEESIKAYNKIKIRDYHFFITLVQNRLASIRNVQKKNIDK